MATVYIASLWQPNITEQIAKAFRNWSVDVSLVSLNEFEKDSYINVDVPELEDEQVASKIEIIFADVPVLAKYRKKLINLKWAHTAWNGVDILMNSFGDGEPLPTFALTKTPGSINADLIAEYVIGYIIGNERSFIKGRELQKNHDWQQLKMAEKTHRLSSRSIGILGVGEIGKHLAKICKAFGMTVWGLTRRKYTPETGCQYVDEYRTPDQLNDILQNSDYICNLLPSTPQSKYMLTTEVLQHCESRKSVFINVGRGDVIREECLVKALQNGWLGGAILDVFDEEPLPESSPLWTMPNVIVTPHVSGWAPTQKYVTSVLDCFVQNYKNYVEGKPLQGTFNWSQGY
ncbi:hypothetical protein ACF0H5_015627 [Mactra antiquata]